MDSFGGDWEHHWNTERGRKNTSFSSIYMRWCEPALADPVSMQIFTLFQNRVSVAYAAVGTCPLGVIPVGQCLPGRICSCRQMSHSTLGNACPALRHTTLSSMAGCMQACPQNLLSFALPAFPCSLFLFSTAYRAWPGRRSRWRRNPGKAGDGWGQRRWLVL